MSKISHILILAELLLIVLVAVASWLLSALGYSDQNLLSAQGLRWLFSHPVPEWESTMLLWALWLFTALGCTRLSGLSGEIWNWITGQGKQSTRRQRYALRLAGLATACGIVFLLHCALAPSSPLLGVTGKLWPSPYLDGLLPCICLITIIVSLIFARASQRYISWVDTIGLLERSLARYTPWAVLLFVSGYLLNICNYVF